MSKLGDRKSVEAYVHQVAAKRGWALNSDTDLTDPILRGLSEHAQKSGLPYCPCRDIEGPEGSNKDIVCPCKYAAADIDEWGQCYCGLFLKIGKNPKQVSSIPERRPQE